MPINTDLNIAPYFDDFDTENQFYKILFKPGFAVQARELTQIQSILQNQVETFGDNIFKEGSIVKGCTFTNLNKLQYVKLADKAGFDVETFVSKTVIETINSVETEVDYVYELEGDVTGLKAKIIQASRGFTTRPPDLNTFYINYLTTNEANNAKFFGKGELLKINSYKYIGETLISTSLNIQSISVNNAASEAARTGKSFGIQSAPGIIFQKGSFLFTNTQTIIVEKYSELPNLKSVGFDVTETVVSSLQDPSLFDNANGSTNENAPGADRLKLVPQLVAKETSVADTDADFFTLIRYVDGNAVLLRDVSQYNALGDEMARRTYEESGNYITSQFKVRSEKRSANTGLQAVIQPGIAYVKGYRVENGAEQALNIDQIANTVIQQNQPVSVQYGGYLNIDGDLTGGGEIDFTTANIYDTSDAQLGTAMIRNITPDKVYLFNVRMNVASKSFKDIVKIRGFNNTNLQGTINVADGAVSEDHSRAPMIFDTGVFSVKGTTNITVPIRSRIQDITVAGGSFTLDDGDNAYDYDVNHDDTAVIVQGSGAVVNVTGTSTNITKSELTVTTDLTAGTATAYVNRNITATQPYSKQAVKPFVKVNYVTSTVGYSLGFPDVYKIISIEDSSGTNFTNSFRLITNQKDDFYDISYMEHITGRPKPADGLLTIGLGVFEINNSTGDYFFTINSYPIDDVSATLPSDKIRSQDLHVYKGKNGRYYNLRESVDFRPYVDRDALADYDVTTAAAAPTITALPDDTLPTFSQNSDYIVPAANEAINMDIESYNARMDLVTIDSFGALEIVKGEEEQHPTPPKISKDKLVISEILIPGYPALSAFDADRQKKPEYAVRTLPSGTKRYTMSDIRAIDDRIDRLEYYVSLSTLEQSVNSINVLDGNGLNRFKNGYIAEPFANLKFSNMEDPLFRSAVLFDKQIMTPPVRTFPMSLKFKSSTSSTIFPTSAIADTGTLSRNSHVSIIKQPFGTNFRNCVSNFYQYDGVGQLHPSHDFGVDTTVNPVPITLDLAKPFEDFADAIQEFIPLTGSRTVNVGSSVSVAGRTTTTTSTLATTTSSLEINETSTDNQVGDFVSNLEFNPFIRPKRVNVFISGLRPDTKHYFFFDGQNINNRVSPGTDADDSRSVKKFGQRGDEVETDSSGILRAVFDIPSETFYVGERKFEVADVSIYDNIESAGTSSAKLTYHAYNIDLEKQSLQTRVPDIDVATVRTTRNVTSRVTAPQENNSGDPLAQTFFIKSGMGKSVNTVMLSKVDLYFRRASIVNGVNIQIREVVNGYPSAEIIAFGQVHLKPSEVNTSDDASVATTVDFEAPLRLETETEYAIVIKPDANDPDYLVYTSKVGGTDLTPGDTQGQAIVQDWGDGVLFTSTNNRAWKSYQDEDLKFTLYRHDFNSSSGSITLTNNDNEFFTLSSWDGDFEQDEIAYQLKSRSGSTAEAMSVAINSTTVTGTALDDTYSAGDFVRIKNSGGTREDIFEIVSVDSATEMTVAEKASFIGVTGLPVVAGVVSYHNFRHPEKLYIEQSSATTTFNFETSNTIIGFSTGTEGTISSVDDINLSYIQPMIQKTNDSTSRTSLEGNFVDTTNPINYYDHPMKFADSTHFAQKGVIVYSKTNNLSGTKPFDITVNLTNGNNSASSPLIDIETSILLANQYDIGNDANTSAKYISSIVELAEDLDAEDIKVYLTGYRPKGTEIKVYIKPQHPFDAESFDKLSWIELEITDGARTFSSTSNQEDYREFVYGLAAANKNVDDALVYTSGDGGDWVGFRKFAIRIDLLSPNIHTVPTVADYRAIAVT